MAFGAIFVPDFLLQAVGRSGAGIRNRPVALIDGHAPNFHVIAVNRLANQLGITPGMTKTTAAEFDGVEILPRRMDLEVSAHAALLDAAWSFSPRVEDTAVDTVLLDLAGLATLFGSYENIALQIKSRWRFPRIRKPPASLRGQTPVRRLFPKARKPSSCNPCP
jgi:nucleotidyltransferase/DNA polymerase involved in DNA repair